MSEPDPTRGVSPLTFTPEPYSAPVQTYSQWSSTAGSGITDPRTSYVGYADYQRGHYLTTGELTEEVEQSIQSGLAGVLVENNLSTQEELPQFLAPRTSTPEQDAALVQRAFGVTAGAEYTQALSDGSAEESTLRKQLNDAKTALVETGQLAFARLTNDEGSHEIIGGGTDASTFDTAVRDGALSYADAYMVAQGLKKVGATGNTVFEEQAHQRLKGELNTLITSGTDNYTKDAVGTVSNFLKSEDKGDISGVNLNSQIALVRRDLARQFGETNQFDADALRSRYSDTQIRQALEDATVSKLNFESGFDYYEDIGDESKNIRITERGNAFAHPSLMMQRERFERAVASDTRLDESQKQALLRSRDVYRETMFSHYDKMLTETNATSDKWLKSKTAGRVRGASDTDILDAFLMDGENYSSFSNKLGAVGASVWDAVAGLFAGVGALVFKSEGATNTLVEIQQDAARRQEVASLFGKDFGFGMDVATTIAPMVADVAATAFLSSFTAGVGGAAYLTAKTGATVTAKGLVTNLTGRMMVKKMTTAGVKETAEEVSERLFASRLIASASREASEQGVMDAIDAYNKVVFNKLFRKTVGPAGMVTQFLGAANRQSGSSYATIYASLPEDMTHDEKHDHAFGYAMLAGTITGLVTAAFQGIGRGGFENAFLGGMTHKQARRAMKQLVGAADELPDTAVSNKLRSFLSEGMKKTTRRAFPEFLSSGMDEFLEEGVDEFINSFIMDAALDEDTPMREKIMGALHAGAVGGVIGGGVAGVRSGLNRIRGPRGDYERFQEEQIDAAVTKLEESGSPLTAQAVRDVKQFLMQDARDRDASTAPTLDVAPTEPEGAEVDEAVDDTPLEGMEDAATPENVEETLNGQLDAEIDAQSEEPMTASSAATAGGVDTKPLREPADRISGLLEQLAALSNRVKVRARKFTPSKSPVKFTRGQFIEDESTSEEVIAFNKAVLNGAPLVLESGKHGMPERTEIPEGYYEGKTQLLNELIDQKYPAVAPQIKGTKSWQGTNGEKGRVDSVGIGEFDNTPATAVAMLRAGIPVKSPPEGTKDVNPSFIYDRGSDFISGVRINAGEGDIRIVRLNRVESPLPEFEESLQRLSSVLNLFKPTGTVPSGDIQEAAKAFEELEADIAANATASLEVEANLALRLLDLLDDLDQTAGTSSPDQTTYNDPTDTAVDVFVNKLALWVPAGQAKQQAADILAKNLPITVDAKANPDGVIKAFLRDFVMNDVMLTKGELDLGMAADRVRRRYSVIQNTHRNIDARQYPDAPYTAKLTNSTVAATIDPRAVDVVPNNVLQASADLDASPPLREALNKALRALNITTPEKLSSDAALGVLLRNDLMRNPKAPAPEVLAFYNAAKAATLKGNYRALRLLGRWTDAVDGELQLDWEFISDIKAGAEAVIGSQMSNDQTITLINALRHESLTLYSRSRPSSVNTRRAITANGNEVERLGLESNNPDSVVKALKKIANDKKASKETRTAAKLLLRNKNLIANVEFRIRENGDGYAGKYIRYDDGTHAVELYLDGHGAGGVEGVLLHEYVHALTAVALTAPDSDLTPAQRAARDQLIAVFEEAEAAVIASDNSAFAASVENVSEFVAHVFTSPEFQAFLKTHKTADTPTNFFQRIMDSILRFLSVKGTLDNPTLHRDALAAVTGFTDTLTKVGRESASAVAGQVAQDTRSRLNRTRRILAEHPAISVTHGSASIKTFDQFSNDFMGTGEGAQMNGWGSYFADVEEVTRQYQDQGAAHSVRVVYKNNKNTENLGAALRRLMQSRLNASAKYGDNSPQYQYAATVELEAQLLLRGLRDAARERKEATGTAEEAQADFEEYLADIRSATLTSQYPELGVIYRALSDIENIQDIEYSTGTHYRVDIEVEPDELLAWDRSLDEQSLYVQMAIGSSDNPSIQAAYDAVFQTEQLRGKQSGIATGAKFYRALTEELGSPRAASQMLVSIGIRGHRFFDQDTRGRAEAQVSANEDSANYAIPENPTYNYVIFDDTALTTTAVEDPHGNEQKLMRLRTQTGAQEKFEAPTKEEQEEADRLMSMMGNVLARFGIDFSFTVGTGAGVAYYDVNSKKVMVDKLSVIATMRETEGLGAIEQVLLAVTREESGHRASRKGVSKKMFKAAMDELSGQEYLDISERYFDGVDPDRSKRDYVEQVLAGEEVPEAFGLPNNPEGMKEYLLEEKLRMSWQRRRYGFTTEETYNFYKGKPKATQVVLRYLKGLINRFQEYIKVYGNDSALSEAVNELVEQANAMYGAQRIPRIDFNPDEPDEFTQQLASQIGQLSMTPREDSRLERVVESVEQYRRALHDVSMDIDPDEPVPEIVLHDTKQDFDSAMDAISKGGAAQRFTETGRWIPYAGEGARGQVHINLEHASDSTVAQEVFNAVFDLRTPETEDKANAGAEMLTKIRNILLSGSRTDIEISEALDKTLTRGALESSANWSDRGSEYIADLAGYTARIHQYLSKPTRERLNQWLNSFTDKFSGEPIIESDESYIAFLLSFGRSAGEAAGGLPLYGETLGGGEDSIAGGIMKTLGLAEEESVPLTDSPITISAGALTQQSSVGWLKGVEGAGDWFQKDNVEQVDVKKLFEKFRKENGRDPAVWVWMTDQLKRGQYVSPVTDGLQMNLQGGMGFALDPSNKENNRLWASGMPPKELEERIKASDFIWLATGAPMSSHNFSRGTSEVWVAELEAAMKRKIADGGGTTSYEIITGTGERETINLTDGTLEEFAAIMQKYIPVLGEGLTHGAKTSWGKINTALAAAVKGKEELLGNTGARGRFAAEMFRDSMSKNLREGTRFHFVHTFLGVPTKDVVLPQVLEPFHINNENKQGDLVMLLEPEGIKVDDNFHDSYPHTVTGKVVGIPTRKFNIRDVAPQDLIDKSMELTKAGKVPSLVNQLKTLMGDAPNVYGAIKGNLTRQWMQSPLALRTSIGAMPDTPIASQENMVGAASGVLSKLIAPEVDYPQRLEYHNQINAAIIGEDGEDRIAQAIGIDSPKLLLTLPSIWIPDSGIPEINPADAMSGFSTKEHAQAYAIIRGVVTQQNAIGGSRAKYIKDSINIDDAIESDTEGNTKLAYFLPISKEKRTEKLLTDVHKGLNGNDTAVFHRPDGLLIAHLAFDPEYTPTIFDNDTEKIAKALGTEQFRLPTEVFYAENEFEEQDTERAQNIRNYGTGFGLVKNRIPSDITRRPSDIQRRLGNLVKDIQSVNDEFSDKGFGAAGDLPARVNSYFQRTSVGTIVDSFDLPTGTTPLEFEGGLLKIDGETVSAGVTEFVQRLGRYADLAIRKTKNRKGDGWSDVLLVDGLFELDLNDALALPEDFSPRTETGDIRLASRSRMVPVGITVDSVKALKKGSGVRALRLLTKVADDLGVRLEGTANAFGTVEGEKGLSTDELIRFYKHFGFTFDKLGNGSREPIPKSPVIKLKGFRRQFTSIGAIDDMFFSGVEETISDRMPAKASASQVKGILKGKVKKAEVEWLGLDEWLADRESVTRDEVMSFIDENKVRIEEVDKFVEDYETKYEEYTLAGGENYREFLITMPDREGLPTVLQRDYLSSHWDGTPNVVVHIRVKDRVTEDGKKVLHIEEIQSDWAGDIRKAGTRDAGEIARLRVEHNEALDKRAAMMEEQYSRLQQFVEASPQLSEYSLEPAQWVGSLLKSPRLVLDVVRFDSQPPPKLPSYSNILGWIETERAWAAKGRIRSQRFNWSWLTAERLEAFKNNPLEVSRLDDKINDLAGKISAAKGAAPDMPFVNNYHELALKRILRRAAVEGYEGITWSTGKSQIELYSSALRQNVDKIEWTKATTVLPANAYDRWEVGTPVTRWSLLPEGVVILKVAPSNEEFIVAIEGKTERDKAEGKTLEDVVGGKIAKQIREGEAQGTVEGDDLSIGGHFHKLLYDQMIPTALRKLTKRWGGEVTETVVEGGEYTAMSEFAGEPISHDVRQLLFTEGMAEGAQQVHALHTSIGNFDGTNISYGKDIVDMINMPVFEDEGYRKQAKKGWRRWLQNAFKGTLDPRVGRLLELRDQVRRAVQFDLERWNSEMERIIKEEYTDKGLEAPLDEIQILSGSQENVSISTESKRIQAQYDAEVNALQDQLASKSITPEEFSEAIKAADTKKETLERDVLLQKRKKFRSRKAATIKKLRGEGGKRVIIHVRDLRSTVDRLTQRLKDEYGIEGELGLTMDANMGIYLTKSYRMFTDAGWADQVLTDKSEAFGTIRNNATEYFKKSYVRERTRQIRVGDPSLSYAVAKRMAEKELKDNPDIGDSMMRAFVASYSKDSTLEGDAIRHKDRLKALIDSFKGRKELPAELSALLGEHSDSTGYNSLLRTYMHVGIMASHQAFLNHVKKLGMDSGWVKDSESLSDEEKATFKPIKGAATEKYDPFNVDGKQLFAPAEMVDNLKALLDPVAMGNMANAAVKTASDLTKTASVLTGLSLGAKTMGSIGFFVRNVISNIAFFGPAQGLGFGTTGKMGGHLVKELRRRVFRMTPEERSNYYTELTALGVIGDEIRPQLFDELMGGQTNEQSLLKGMDTLLGEFPKDEGVVAKTGRNKLVKKLGKLKTLSSSVDAFYKIAMFEHELRVLEQARDARAGDKFETMTDEELKQEASIKVKMTAQSYSQAPPFIEGWSRSSVGVLFAPFLRFKMEVPRIIFNTQKLWAEEIATGNPVLVKRGKARRRGFMLTSVGFSIAAPTAMRVMMGIGEDEDEALRDSMPEYLRTNTFFYLPTSDDGRVSVDLTFMNPFAIMADPILRFTEHMVRGEPAEGGAVFFKAMIANQYLDEQIFAGAVRATLSNKNPETNRPIWERYDSPIESFGKSLSFLFKEAYAPKTPAAVVGSITKMVNGVDPVGTGAFLRSPAGAMLAELLPVKPHKIELDKQLNRFLSERREEYNRVSGRKNVLLTDDPVSSDEIKRIAMEEIEDRIAINQHMMRAFRGFEGLGMTKAEIFTQAKERGVGKERLTLLFAGLMDRPMLTPPYIERMAAKGAEHVKRLRELHAEFKSHPRYIPLD